MKKSERRFQSEEPKKTLMSRINDFRDKYKSHTAATIAVLMTLALILSEFIPAIKQFISDYNVVQYLILLFVLDIASTVSSGRKSKTHHIAENQDESMPILKSRSNLSRSKGAELIEYAGATTLPLIRSLKRNNVPIKILIKHPDTVSGIQKTRTIATLETLYNSVFEDYDKFEIRCYRLPYSLRGRKIGDEILELGWLTPDVKRETAFGHANPSLLLDLRENFDTKCVNFFDKTFDTFWNHVDTVDGRTLIPQEIDEKLELKETITNKRSGRS